MMPKPKIIKKGYDPPGNTYIPLGTSSTNKPSSAGITSSSSSSSSSNSSTNNNNSSTTNQIQQSIESQLQTQQLNTTSLTTSSLTNNNTNNNNNISNNNNNNKSSTKLLNQNSSSTSNLVALGANSNSNYLDPKTIKDEINKALEKEESNEKLIKLIRSVILNLKSPLNSVSQTTLNKQQQQQQQQQQLQNQQQQNNNFQQPDLNFLMALSYVALKKPQLFLKQANLVDFLCINLLFTSKLTQLDKSATSGLSGSSSSSSVLKSKSLQMLRAPGSPQQQALLSIQPTICNIIYLIYENENFWPDIFIKAYVDDSLGERAWVDNVQCKDFVLNIQTAFNTKPIPFSVDNPALLTPTGGVGGVGGSGGQNSGSSNDLQQLAQNEIQISQQQNPIGLIETTLNKKNNPIARYASMRNEIEILVVDMIRNQISNKPSQSQRILGQTNSIALQTSAANIVDNRNFLKLLQSTCGFGEVRAIALSKIEGWLSNPKLVTCAQDLLLAICVNCNQGDQTDKEIIGQMIRLKPKAKQQQHYFDCIRELIKQNSTNFEIFIQLTILNELSAQQQHYNQHQSQQQQQQAPPPRNQHNINLLQTAFSTDGLLASKIFAQIMQKILLQRNGEEYLRALRSLLRDTIRNCRQDFDLIKFTSELVNDNLIKQYFSSASSWSSSSSSIQTTNDSCQLLNLAGGLADFSQIQIRERYVNGICDLITVCILVAITPTIKEAYVRRQQETKEILIKYYLSMSKIQCDTVTWLQCIVVGLYKINPTELIRCMFKILFMVDKPEQCYTIDNWPSEQERATMFRVVSEIPVLSETLHQVLMITKSLPDHMFMLMLCVEENLLKTAALVHMKDIYSLKLNRVDQFIQSLFNICLYTYQNPPTVTLVVTVLYWRAWQILLIITALDPKGFGLIAWDQYPTLRLLMEMIMTEDYNYPPQSSITEEFNIDYFRSIENQASYLEKQEILEFENLFEMKQASKIIRTEANSKLIGQVMKFDPTGPPRRPTNETILNIRKLNAEYKLGQLLCKSRQPDFLLNLIKRQNSSLSLPWLSSLIDSSSNDCLEILPIQCICEFVWNILSGTVEEIPLKKQINLEQLLQRLKQTLITTNLNDSLTIQQINDTFDYFLNKLCSDKLNVRIGSLKILNKIFLSSTALMEKQILSNGTIGGGIGGLTSQQIDLGQLIDAIKQLNAFDIYIKPLLIKYFRRVLNVETNSTYLNIYLNFLFEQFINDYKQQYDLECSLQMQFDSSTSTPTNNNFSILIKNESFKTNYNQIAIDLATFFFNRPFCLNTILNSNEQQQTPTRLSIYFAKFCQIILSLNEYDLEKEDDDQRRHSRRPRRHGNQVRDHNDHTDDDQEEDEDEEEEDDDDDEENNSIRNIKTLIKTKPVFDRNCLERNSYLLIELSPTMYTYIHEKIFNLVIYLILLDIEPIGASDSTKDDAYFSQYYDEFINLFKGSFLFQFHRLKFLNCQIKDAFNNLLKDKILRIFNRNVKAQDLIEIYMSHHYQHQQQHQQNHLDDNEIKKEKSTSKIVRLFAVRIVSSLIDSIASNCDTRSQSIDNHHDTDDVSNRLDDLFDCLLNKYGLSMFSVYLILNKIEKTFQKYATPSTTTTTISYLVNRVCDRFGINLKSLYEIVESYANKLYLPLRNYFQNENLIVGKYLCGELKKLKKNLLKLKTNGNVMIHNDHKDNDDDDDDRDRNDEDHDEPMNTTDHRHNEHRISSKVDGFSFGFSTKTRYKFKYVNLNSTKSPFSSPSANQRVSFNDSQQQQRVKDDDDTTSNRNDSKLNQQILIQNEYSMSCLNNIQTQIDSLKSNKNRLLKSNDNKKINNFGESFMEKDHDDDHHQDESSTNRKKSIDFVIKYSTNQTLETNLNKTLNKLKSNDQRVVLLCDTILNYENNPLELESCWSNENKTNLSVERRCDGDGDCADGPGGGGIETIACEKRLDYYEKLLTSRTRCVIDILLDYFCHFDTQIVDKQFDCETRLLFELRKLNKNVHIQSSTSNITQPFLLSLFIHQANWQKLQNCVQFLLKSSTECRGYRLNPTIVLDFLSSLIHIPELWKGTESKMLQKYNEENVLSLNENQICNLLDFIMKEMCSLCESKFNFNEFESSSSWSSSSSSSSSLNDEHLDRELRKRLNEFKYDELNDFKFKLHKRVQLLKHFFKSSNINKENLLRKIVNYLESQKNRLKYLFVDLNVNLNENNKKKQQQQQNLNRREDAIREKLFSQIQTLFLYSIYLEENTLINYIRNPHRLFSNLYFQIDIPTKLDVKAHNLLNCFGEIEVNYSMNATSSGIIGVSSSVSTFRKQEKQEIVAFAKKQEAFMMDANLVCIKLASEHPFIFIRQIPMMEGLLQGRVVYSFEEFKRRKFDKLFHYIIDLLNVLVPYVFHRVYLKYIESIISHYFDVFKTYSAENRDSVGSLAQKFFDFLEKFVNTDIQVGYNLIIKKYSNFLTLLYKSYPDINSLKFLNAVLSIPFELVKSKNDDNNNEIAKQIPDDSLASVNIFNQKTISSIWSSKQLEPFINKLLNRDNYDGVLSVLQELDTVSQRQPVILSHFVFYLQQLMKDSNDNLRDLSFALIMRYLRLNPKETPSFFQAFSECLTSSNSKVFNSAIKIFPDFNLLSTEKSHLLIKYALKGAFKHNVDISKTLTDSIRLVNLEKYVH